MLKIFIGLIFLFTQMNISYEEEDEKGINIEPEESITRNITYLKETNFAFNINGENDLQINIRSINCNIEIKSPVEIINRVDFYFYSIKLNSTNKKISILPIKDKMDGQYKENYEVKDCPLAINSFYISKNIQRKVEIKNKEENIFYLNNFLPDDIFEMSYYIKNVTNNSFVALSFKYKEAPLSIDISYKNNKDESYSESKEINNTCYIFLNSSFLLYNDNNKDNNGNLSIHIKNIKNSNIFIFFKIIEENTICLLEKNALNFGFLTSKTIYQYYHTELLNGEEGELMLHNKRLNAKIYAKLVNKTEITDINNISKYPNDNDNDNEKYLEYNQIFLRLKFNYTNTEYCFNGCHLLITYKQNSIENSSNPIGYEYTILSRFWNYTDYISKIIDIPYNEYIISCFGKGASREHYYSIYIPEDADKIIIQFSGAYLEGFYEDGKKKINTLKGKNKLEIKDKGACIYF